MRLGGAAMKQLRGTTLNLLRHRLSPQRCGESFVQATYVLVVCHDEGNVPAFAPCHRPASTDSSTEAGIFFADEVLAGWLP